MSGARSRYCMKSKAAEHRSRTVDPRREILLNCLRCVGACGLAPVVMVGEKVYGRVAPQQVRKIIAEYQEGCVRPEKHEM